jgi:DNA-binding transcriptional regulator YiaG
MPNIATVLKQEITRLARREVNSQTKVIRKASAQYRRDIAQLKRQVAALSKQVTYLEGREQKRASKGVSKASTEGRRFSSRGVKAHREKLGLSAADYASLVGVSAQTIYNWEYGKSKPRDEQLGSLVAVRDLGKREALKQLELLED